MANKSFWTSFPGILTGIASLLTATIAFLTFLSDGNDKPDNHLTDCQRVYSIEIVPQKYSIYAGTTLPLTATIKDKKNQLILNCIIKWKSNHSNIVIVTDNGVAKGMKFGIGLITAECNGKIAKAKLYIGDPKTGLYPSD